ncbi:MAG TPA: LicD family protein [Mycobacteriales bacterium]|nr:LicD family protein [Mycobacteriales bacterium]
MDGRRNRVLRTLLDALHDVDRVCQALGVTYWIDSGTLLGAVREGSPIPWDDDVDLCMLPRDIERFVSAAPALLGPAYLVQTPHDDPAITSTVKVYINGTHAPSAFHALHQLPAPAHDGLFIDIMTVVPVSTSAVLRRIERAMALLVQTASYAAHMARSPALPRGVQRTKWWLVAQLPGWLTRLLERWLTWRQSKRDGNLLGIGAAGIWAAMPREVIFPLSPQRLGGLTLPGPADPDAYLRAEFGDDYMTPPPEHARETHTELVTFDEP